MGSRTHHKSRSERRSSHGPRVGSSRDVPGRGRRWPRAAHVSTGTGRARPCGGRGGRDWGGDPGEGAGVRARAEAARRSQGPRQVCRLTSADAARALCPPPWTPGSAPSTELLEASLGSAHQQPGTLHGTREGGASPGDRAKGAKDPAPGQRCCFATRSPWTRVWWRGRGAEAGPHTGRRGQRGGCWQGLGLVPGWNVTSDPPWPGQGP